MQVRWVKMNEEIEINPEDENERLRQIIKRISNVCFSQDLSLESISEAEKLKLIRLKLMDKTEWINELVSESQDPLEFKCSECGRNTTRDSFTYYSSIPAPDYARKCPTCGHVPYGWFHYCSPECLAKAHPNHISVRYSEREKEIEKIMASRGVDRETAHDVYMKRRGFVRTGKVAWAEPREKPVFHKDFPKLAKDLGFRVYRQGWPDCLIERNGKYVAVEVKDRSGLTERQSLMHQALERAGLRVLVVTPETMDLLGAHENTQ